MHALALNICQHERQVVGLGGCGLVSARPVQAGRAVHPRRQARSHRTLALQTPEGGASFPWRVLCAFFHLWPGCSPRNHSPRRPTRCPQLETSELAEVDLSFLNGKHAIGKTIGSFTLHGTRERHKQSQNLRTKGFTAAPITHSDA
jgi:hypothetical protein